MAGGHLAHHGRAQGPATVWWRSSSVLR